jgi:steroid delta-isomerase-like uncharacterized protein
MTTLAIVEDYYRCFNQKNWEGMLAHLSHDVRHEVNQGEAQIGVDRYRAFLQHMEECYDETLKDIVLMSDASGQRIAAEFVVHGIYIKTDSDLPQARHQRYVLPAGAFIEIKNDKISRLTMYYNLPAWLSMVTG